jgi:hypothetical protein
MGHIEGLMTEMIKDDLRAGYASADYQGGAYQKAYQSQSYKDSGLEDITQKTLVTYDLSLDSQGKVNGYFIEYSIPKGLDARLAPDPNKTGVVLYDAQSQELIEAKKLYEGDVKTLKSSNQEHWVVPQRMIQQEIVRQMFNAPIKESVSTYQSQVQQAAVQQPQADYTARSDLRKKIDDKRKEIGLTKEQVQNIRQQAGQQKIIYN